MGVLPVSDTVQDNPTVEPLSMAAVMVGLPGAVEDGVVSVSEGGDVGGGVDVMVMAGIYNEASVVAVTGSEGGPAPMSVRAITLYLYMVNEDRSVS